MSKRLNDILGLNDQFVEASSKAISAGFGGENDIELADIHMLPLKWICPRYSNKYINDPKTTRALAKSIEQNGLIQPIAVVEIEEYLKKDVDEDERKYLHEMADLYGCKYFISSGHRRFKAALSIALNKDVETQEDIIKFYKSLKTKDLYEDANNPLISPERQDELDKLYIPSKILTNLKESDAAVYNDSNLTSRATTTFELLANVLDSIGKEDASVSEIRTYIYDKYGLEVSESTLYKNMKLLNTFSQDARYLKAIYDGKLTNRDSKVLATIFNRIDKDDVIKQIENKTFNVNALKRSLTKKRQPRKITTYSKAQVLDLLNQIKLKNLTVEEAMKKVSEE